MWLGCIICSQLLTESPDPASRQQLHLRAWTDLCSGNEKKVRDQEAHSIQRDSSPWLPYKDRKDPSGFQES